MYRFTIATVAACLILGCTSTPVFHKYRTVDAHSESPISVAMDAEQRAIIAVPLGESQARTVILCAEPSPDVLSELDRSISIAADAGDEARLAFAQSLLETVEEIGERNATIQLLRDGLYRQCEAYLNGMIDRKVYEEMSNRYVDAMVTLLAIERLTASSGNTGSVSIAKAEREVEIDANVDDEIMASADGANVESSVAGPTDDGGAKSTAKESDGESGNSKNSTKQAESATQSNQPIESVYSGGLGESVGAIAGTFLNKNVIDRCLIYLETSKGTAKDIGNHLDSRFKSIVDRELTISERLASIKIWSEILAQHADSAADARDTGDIFTRDIEEENNKRRGLTRTIGDLLDSAVAKYEAAVSTSAILEEMIDGLDSDGYSSSEGESDGDSSSEGESDEDSSSEGEHEGIRRQYDQLSKDLDRARAVIEQMILIHESFKDSDEQNVANVEAVRATLGSISSEILESAKQMGDVSDQYREDLIEVAREVESVEQEVVLDSGLINDFRNQVALVTICKDALAVLRR